MKIEKNWTKDENLLHITKIVYWKEFDPCGKPQLMFTYDDVMPFIVKVLSIWKI